MNLINKLPFLIGLLLIGFYFFNNDTNITKNNDRDIYQKNQKLYDVVNNSIYDGDTLRVLEGSKELKVRFACIDAPEMAQEFGESSRKYLQSLLEQNNDRVALDITNTDRYGRAIAVVYLPSGEPVQTLQVINGYAYPYPRYKDDCPIWSSIIEAESKARNNRVNIYSKNLIKPWDYRKK